MALRPAVALSRHSSYLGSRLTVHTGRQAPFRQRQSGSSSSRHQVQASFFGVGAPEAVLVGLVALVIFGPQGLAEAAKTAGKTVRAFKPTFDELTSVSRDLRNTLDEELGINDIRNEFRGSNYTSPSRGTQQPDWDNLGTTPVASSKSAAEASGSQDSNQSQEDIDAMRARSANLAWGKAQTAEQQDGAAGSKTDSKIADVSLDELQAELARRRAAKKDVSSA